MEEENRCKQEGQGWDPSTSTNITIHLKSLKPLKKHFRRSSPNRNHTLRNVMHSKEKQPRTF